MADPAQELDLEEIWAADLFGRRADAEALQSYIESVAERQLFREDAQSFTIGIDTPYGVGKTFFLRRLTQHLSLNHPVAYIDAWADDLADQPFTALAATLKKALDPLIAKSVPVSQKFDAVLEKAGRVAKIAALGLLKRGVSLAITAGAADQLDELFKTADTEVQEALQEASKSAGDDAVKIVTDSFDSVVQKGFMRNRIEKFEEAKSAVSDLKYSIKSLIDSMEGSDKYPPIVVIIDELDRCRPTYAVKLLEEVKHMFDVPGLVFVFGMNGDQLASSLNGAYGAHFDGKDYLRRFIQRTYRLPGPDLRPLVEALLKSQNIDLKRLSFPHVSDGTGANFIDVDKADLIARYIHSYNLTPRDTFQVIDMIQTCLSLTKDEPLIMAYLIPLIASRIRGITMGNLSPVINHDNSWRIVVSWSMNRPANTLTPNEYVNAIHLNAKRNASELSRIVNGGDEVASVLLDKIMNGRLRDNSLAQPGNYESLLEAVGRFSVSGGESQT